MPDSSSIALALGQVEEAMGALDDGLPDCRPRAVEALVRARNLLLQATASAAARVPIAHYTPISEEKAGP
jgi:hypothetical protein